MNTEQEPSPIVKVKEVIAKHLHYTPDDRFAIDYTCILTLNGIVKAISDKTWGYLIGPASAGKTELARIFHGHSKVVYVDDLTSNAYVSGTVDDSGGDPSLLATLAGRMLIIKDLAAARSGDGASLNRFQGQLRGAHDNFYTKHSGTHGSRTYDSNHGFMGCTTPIADSSQRLDQQFGERKFNLYMARFNLTHEQAKLHSKAVSHYCTNKIEFRTEINLAARAGLNDAYGYARANTSNWKLPPEAEDWLFDLCFLACRVRTAAVEGHAAFAELPGRMFSVLNSAAACYSFWRYKNEWMEECKPFLSRVVLDTLLPSTRGILLGLSLLNQVDHVWGNVEKLRNSTRGRFPDEVIEDTLREFAEMNLLIEKPGAINAKDYMLTEKTDELIEKVGFLEATPLPLLYRRQSSWPYGIETSSVAPSSQRMTI